MLHLCLMACPSKERQMLLTSVGEMRIREMVNILGWCGAGCEHLQEKNYTLPHGLK